MKKPIKAYGGNGKSVIYEFSDGTGMNKCGGRIGWRSTNSGNITTGSIATKNGSIGNNGRFAIFSDFKTGRNAIYELLKDDIYADKTLSEAIYIYAPPTGNDTEGYIRFLVGVTGFFRDDRLAELDKWFLDDVIIKKEGYLNKANHGEIKFIPDVTKKQRYIWRTRKDIAVRKEHREREGKIFNRNDPPKGGNPGDDFGCRCWAEAFEYDECFEKANPWPKNHGFQIQIVTT